MFRRSSRANNGAATGALTVAGLFISRSPASLALMRDLAEHAGEATGLKGLSFNGTQFSAALSELVVWLSTESIQDSCL